jgi:peptide methionine sulfoxide reductase MsrA
VVKTSVGYTQGKAPNPTYDEVCMGFTGHTEAVQVTYDPKEVSHPIISKSANQPTTRAIDQNAGPAMSITYQNLDHEHREA